MALIKVASLKQVPQGEMVKVEAQGKNILLVNYNNQIHAIENNCSHVGGPLDEGSLTENKVRCPWHGAEYDVLTGKATEDSNIPGLQQSKFRVEVKGEDIFLDI